MRVATPAIGQPLRERLVVVPRDRDDAKLVEDRIDLAWIWTESAEIAEAEDALRTPAARVPGRSADRQVIAVEPAQERERSFEVGVAEQDGRRVNGSAPCGLICDGEPWAAKRITRPILRPTAPLWYARVPFAIRVESERMKRS
jgi:hypothetical protein